MSNLTDNLLIDTPENVLLDAEIAGFGSRCMAALLDYTLLALVFIGVTILFIRATTTITNSTWELALLSLVQFAIILFYHLFFELIWNGQTPGKRRLGLRVVQANGLPVTTSSVIIRNLVRLFDFFPAFYVIGMFMLFVTKHSQRLGDLAARTVVIREKKQLKLDNIRENLTVQYVHINRLSPLPPNIQIGALTQTDRRDIVNYLQRRAQIARREYLVGPLAQQIAKKMGVDMGSEFQSPKRAEMFLEQIARAFEIAEFGQSGETLRADSPTENQDRLR